MTLPPPRRGNLILAALSTTFLLAAVEIALQVLGVPREGIGSAVVTTDRAAGALGPVPWNAPWMRQDPDLLWSYRPGARAHDGAGRTQCWYTINRDGFRSDEVPELPGRPLVLCAGDSVTAGYGASAPDTYPAVLQDLLRARPGLASAFVINTGVSGYSSEQGRLSLARTVPRWKPDVVLVGFGIDDDWPTPFPDELVVGRPSAVGRTQALLRRSHLYCLLRDAIVGAKRERIEAQRRLAARVAPDRYVANLRAMAAIVRESGGRIVFVAPTSEEEHVMERKSVTLHAPLSIYRTLAHAVAFEENAPCLDVPLLSGRLPESRRYFVDWCHPDVEGLCILAREARPLVEEALAPHGP